MFDIYPPFVWRIRFFDYFALLFLGHWDFGFYLTFGFCHLSFYPSLTQYHAISRKAELGISTKLKVYGING
jgi:hypothetical protein